MPTLAGVLNGSKVVIEAETAAGIFTLIGGQQSHNKNLTLAPVEISNKSLANVREYLEGEGLKTADVSGEMLFSSDAAYEFMVARFEDKTAFNILIKYGALLDRIDRIKVRVTALSDNPSQNTALISSVTLSSTEGFELSFSLFNLLTSTGEFLKTSSGEQLLVKG